VRKGAQELRLSSVAEHTAPPKGASIPPSCNKCSSAGMELLTVLPHLGDRPTFHIFRCIACGFIDWIAEATEKPAQ